MKRLFSNIEKIFTYPVIITLIMGTVIILLLPPLFKKYDLQIKEHQNIYYDNYIEFSDLDNDGFSERISLSTVNNDYSYVNFYNHQEALSQVWNLKGKINNKSLAVGDYNNDGKKEVYLITMQNDSLFLNCYHYFQKKEEIVEKKFITEIPKHYNKPDWDISDPQLIDLNKNGYKELVFSLFGKYSLQPRQIITYDIKNQIFSKSPSIGTIMKDIKVIKSKDKKNYFITGNTSVTNYFGDSTEVDYKDDKAWLIVYNKYFRPQFDPIPFEEQGTILQTYPLAYNNMIYFTVLITNHFDYENSKLLVINTEGEIINTFNAKDYEMEKVFGTQNLPANQFYVINNSDEVFLMNHHLTILNRYDVSYTKSSTFFARNLDNDNQQEIIQWVPSRKKAILYRKNFKEKVEIKLPELQSRNLDISLRKTPSQNQICFRDYNHYYMVAYKKSTLYPLKYAIHGAIYIILFLILYAIQKTIALRRLRQERVISQLKLTSIKNQIDPHFTLNALNAIGSSILNDYKKESYDHLQRFSRLIRHSLTEADNVSRSLNDEINFIKDYLNVLQIRFVDKFDYRLEIEENADLSHHVPKMIIQSFVENAFNHGIKPKSGKGLLKIQITGDDKGIEAIVQDDGIGRGTAVERGNTKNTGKGLNNINEYINIFNKYNKQKISYRIIDLFDNRKPAGTLIKIYIPYDYEYKIH
ncbi:MAG: histidine kinase [Bacteroidales bacterium]|nr:histidine kinase [Bacteroidales bacterium]MCF8334116.1 histidine kinase [Bacteroidales bacterium]